MIMLKKKCFKSKRTIVHGFCFQMLLGAVAFALLTMPAKAHDNLERHEQRAKWTRGHQENEQPWGATSIIIETTDNDIELQVFVDGFLWKSLQVFTPDERRIFNLSTRRNIKRQGGLSELFFASEPTHYLENEPNFDGTIDEFLARFPEGEYEFEGSTVDGVQLSGSATLTHVLPALPEITAPVSDGDGPPMVDPNNLVIEWEPVTTQFMSDDPVEIIEYQVILDQEDPIRDVPWIDGKTRRALINLPPDVTRFKVPPEFLLPNTSYAFEIMAIEASGNSTISVGEFFTSGP
jgi:hypothetical protein